MSSRKYNLQALAEAAKDLPDEELRKIESFARYLKTKKENPRLETAGAIIHWLASLRDSRDGMVAFPPRSLLDLADKWLAEGEGTEDTLFKTADALMRYYAEKGSKEFRSRFGSLDILEVCRKIIKEGEGNPHPWD